MVKIIITLLLIVLTCTSSLAVVELDGDTNGAVDLTRGGTNATSAVGARSALGLGSAATTDSTAYATAAQGDLADTAIQPADVGTAAATDSTDYATAAQGVLADSALQSETSHADVLVTGDIGVTVQAFGASGGVSEGVDVLSTGETGGTKFLGEDGDGTSSWKVIPGSGTGTAADLDAGTAIGNVAVYEDDGFGNASLPIGEVIDPSAFGLGLSVTDDTLQEIADAVNAALPSGNTPDGAKRLNVYNSIAETFTEVDGDCYIDSTYSWQCFDGTSWSGVGSGVADGGRYFNVYNSVAETFAESTGDCYLDDAFALQCFNGTTWNGISGGGAWGEITGTLSAQTDLQNALALKYDASLVDVNMVTWPIAVSAAEVSHLDGVTSPIQGQLEALTTTTGGFTTTTDALAAQIASLIVNMENFGIDASGPVFTRTAPATLTPSIAADTLLLDYSLVDDATGVASVTYSLNGGADTAFTTGTGIGAYSTTVTGFTDAGSDTLVVTATDTSPGALVTTETFTVSYASPANLTATPSSKDFGVVTESLTDVQSFVITNTGGQPLTMDATAYTLVGDAEYTETANTCNGAVLALNQTCAVEVTYAPVATGIVLAENIGAVTGVSEVRNDALAQAAVLTAGTVNSITVWISTVNGVGGNMEVRVSSNLDFTSPLTSGTLAVTSADNGTAVSIPVTPYVAAGGTYYLAITGPTVYADRVEVGRTAADYTAGSIYLGAVWNLTGASANDGSDMYFQVVE